MSLYLYISSSLFSLACLKNRLNNKTTSHQSGRLKNIPHSHRIFPLGVCTRMPPSRFHYVCAVLFSRAHRSAASEIIRDHQASSFYYNIMCVFGRSRAPRNELFKLCYGLNQSLVRGNVPSQHKASPRTITNRFLSRAAQCDVLERITQRCLGGCHDTQNYTPLLLAVTQY